MHLIIEPINAYLHVTVDGAGTSLRPLSSNLTQRTNWTDQQTERPLRASVDKITHAMTTDPDAGLLNMFLLLS